MRYVWRYVPLIGYTIGLFTGSGMRVFSDHYYIPLLVGVVVLAVVDIFHAKQIEKR